MTVFRVPTLVGLLVNERTQLKLVL